VWRALRTLTLRERRVIALRFYEDLTEADTARLMGVAVGTVKSTTSRALGKLRDHPALGLQLLEDHR
jgi:RNA polymerase sigma factor (sigma-70 family)